MEEFEQAQAQMRAICRTKFDVTDEDIESFNNLTYTTTDNNDIFKVN